MNLSEKALLVSVSFHRFWGATTDDEIAERMIGEKYGVDPRVVQCRKTLLDPKHIPVLKKVNNLKSQLYTFHKERTVPWLDDGSRMLAAAGYQEYITGVSERKERLLDCYLREFLPELPRLKEQAKIELNGLYREEDWPDPDILAERVKVIVRVYPISDPNDIRVGKDEAEIEEIRAGAEKAAFSAMSATLEEITRRLRVAVSDMIERVEPYGRDAKGKVVGGFKDTAVNNLRELVQLIPTLNVLDNPVIAGLTAEIDATLCRRDAQELRDNVVVRKQVVNEAKDIREKLAQVESILGQQAVAA